MYISVLWDDLSGSKENAIPSNPSWMAGYHPVRGYAVDYELENRALLPALRSFHAWLQNVLPTRCHSALGNSQLRERMQQRRIHHILSFIIGTQCSDS